MVETALDAVARADYPLERLKSSADDGSTDDTWLDIEKARGLCPA